MNTLRYYINLIKESELVEPKVTRQQVKNINMLKLGRHYFKKAGDEKSGYYAYSKELDPHQIKLTTFNPVRSDDDGKLQYIEAIKPLMGVNPYVPNVYEIRLVKANNFQYNSQKPQYVMQKLLSHKQLSASQLFLACDPVIKSCLFGDLYNSYDDLIDRYKKLKDKANEINQEYTKYSGNNTNRILNLNIKNECVKLTVACLKILLNSGSASKDENLNQVIKIIQDIAESPSGFKNFDYDVHPGNFMFRPGPYGYQLVITDPLA